MAASDTWFTVKQIAVKITGVALLSSQQVVQIRGGNKGLESGFHNILMSSQYPECR